MTDEGNISNYLGVNIKKKSDGTFKLLQSHLVEKIINHVGITMSASINSRETLAVKQLPYKEESSLERKWVCNYRAEVGMERYLQESTRPEISMAVHQCALFCNTPRLIQERSVKRITK